MQRPALPSTRSLSWVCDWGIVPPLPSASPAPPTLITKKERKNKQNKKQGIQQKKRQHANHRIIDKKKIGPRTTFFLKERNKPGPDWRCGAETWPHAAWRGALPRTCARRPAWWTTGQRHPAECSCNEKRGIIKKKRKNKKNKKKKSKKSKKKREKRKGRWAKRKKIEKKGSEKKDRTAARFIPGPSPWRT